MKVRYTAASRAEADEILAHIASDNAPAAAAVAAVIEATVARLLSFPRIGTDTDVPGVYIAIARPYHYLIFYSIDGDTLIISNVRHPARHRPASGRA